MSKQTFRIREGEPLLDVVSYGRDGPRGTSGRLTPARLEQIRRTVGRAPEVVVKVLPRASNQLTARMRNRLEERVAERERIARELHDTLLQGVQGLILKFQDATEEIPPDTAARRKMEEALDRADDVLIEGRDRVKDLRTSPGSGLDLAPVIGAMGAELAKRHSGHFNLSVDGTPQPLAPIVQEEVICIAREALANAFRHARATKIETEIIYHRAEFRVRIRDDGCGIDGSILETGRPDHWGLPGMRERAKKIRASFEVWSRPGAGTEIELRVSAGVAYLRSGRRWRWWTGGVRRAEH